MPSDVIVLLFVLLLIACVAWAVGCAILAISFVFRWAYMRLMGKG